jgi:predicted kinase
MSGLPGAGKDTWLARHRPDLPVVSLDGIRANLDIEPTENQGEVIQQARDQCREHLRAGTDFALNATNIIHQTRKQWVDLAADYGARVEMVYLEPDLLTLYEQNARRARKVPRAVVEQMVEKLEPPTWAEAHSLVMGG